MMFTPSLEEEDTGAKGSQHGGAEGEPGTEGLYHKEVIRVVKVFGTGRKLEAEELLRWGGEGPGSNGVCSAGKGIFAAAPSRSRLPAPRTRTRATRERRIIMVPSSVSLHCA